MGRTKNFKYTLSSTFSFFLRKWREVVHLYLCQWLEKHHVVCLLLQKLDSKLSKVQCIFTSPLWFFHLGDKANCGIVLTICWVLLYCMYIKFMQRPIKWLMGFDCQINEPWHIRRSPNGWTTSATELSEGGGCSGIHLRNEVSFFSLRTVLRTKVRQ